MLAHPSLVCIHINRCCKIKARDATEEAIIELFDLTLDKSNVWILAEKNLLEVPLLLSMLLAILYPSANLSAVRNLNDLKYALYADSEATCRMAIDIILVQCRKYLRQKCEADNAANNNGVQPSTSAGVTRNSPPRADRINKVKLIPETSLSVDIYSDSFPGIKYRITGRADWTFGYKDNGLKDDISKDDERTLFVAIEAKQRSEFSNGETQLITYLAILRENRLRAKKRNVRTQGFYSDGERFAFISISQDGIIQKSRIFDITEDDDLKIVYNFITTMMETALKSSPTSSPTKQGEKQEEEINCYHDEVWLKAYALREKGKQRHD